MQHLYVLFCWTPAVRLLQGRRNGNHFRNAASTLATVRRVTETGAGRPLTDGRSSCGDPETLMRFLPECSLSRYYRHESQLICHPFSSRFRISVASIRNWTSSACRACRAAELQSPITACAVCNPGRTHDEPRA